MTDDNSQKITLAVLGNKLDNIQGLLQTHIDDDHERYKDHENRIRYTEQELVRLDQRLTHTTGILAALQVVFVGIGTWLGLKQ